MHHSLQPAAAATAQAGTAGTQVTDLMELDGKSQKDASPGIPVVHPTGHIHPENKKLQIEQFLSMPSVELRLSSGCKNFAEASAALEQARKNLDSFISHGNKQGRTKQLPRQLLLHMSSRTKPNAVPGNDNFYADELDEIRQLERETSDKFFDILVKTKEKLVKFLEKKCNIRDFVIATVQESRPYLDNYTTQYNRQVGVDPLIASQSSYSLSTAEVISHFETELFSRLSAQAFARADAKEKERQQKANKLIEENKAQESVLAGAHTGETIAMIAKAQVAKQTTDMMRKIQELEKQLQLQQKIIEKVKIQPPASASHPKIIVPNNSRDDYCGQNQQHKVSSSSNRSVHFSGKIRSDSPQRTVLNIANKQNRKRKEESTQHDSDHNRKSDSEENPDRHRRSHQTHTSDQSIGRVQHNSNKRHKLTVTLPPKNGVGGDRNSNSAQQHQSRSFRPMVTLNENKAKQKGKGLRSESH